MHYQVDKQLEKLNADTVFDFIDKSPLDTLHRKVLKYILGVNKSSPNLAIYGDTGEIPLTIKGFTLLVNFWLHFLVSLWLPFWLPPGEPGSQGITENVERQSQRRSIHTTIQT